MQLTNTPVYPEQLSDNRFFSGIIPRKKRENDATNWHSYWLYMYKF